MALFITVDWCKPEGNEGEDQFVLLELLGKVIFIFHIDLIKDQFVVIYEFILFKLSIKKFVLTEFLPHSKQLILMLNYFVDNVIKLV